MNGTATGGSCVTAVVHVIDQLRPGGPLQALISFSREPGSAATTRHRVISLLPPDARAVATAERAGLAIAPRPDPAVLQRELAAADIVQVHFWNNPTIHAWMTTELPAMRVLIWCHVNGQHGPHVLPRSLFAFGDLVAATSPASLELPAFLEAPAECRLAIPAGADFSRLAGVQPLSHDGLTVGYLGSLDFTKLHPEVIPLSAAVRVATARFHFCGDGGDKPLLEQQARHHGISDRCCFTGHREDIAPLLAAFTVFGYPLRPHNTCTSELALQEAMHAGVPPVIFPHGGLDRLVRHGETGLVVTTLEEYPRAIEWLLQHPAERQRLGKQAAREARERFGGGPTAAGMAAAYERLLALPKRRRHLPRATGAGGFLACLDGRDDSPFRASLAGDEPAASAADRVIAGLGPVWRHVILQYRVAYPSDPHLRLWSGLALAAERPALAASEFRACEQLGLAAGRISRHLAQLRSHQHA